MFDPNVYAQLSAIDPAAAANYLTVTATQAPAVTTPPPPAPTAQPNLQQGFQQQAAAPQQIAARGTLEDFFNQPSGGGGPSVTSKFFNDNKPQGSWLQMTVLADVTNADVQHQKTPQGVLQYFKKNGQDDLTRPKLVLVVKVNVTGSSDGSHVTAFPDGVASLWLKKGPVTDNLVRAMTAAGDPSGYPKAGAQMVMISAGSQPSRTVGFSATKLYDFQYAAPAGSVDPTAVISAAAPAVASATAGVTSALPVPPVPAVSSTAISAAPTIPPVPSTPASTAPAAPPAPAPTVTAPPLSTPPVPEANFTPPPPAPEDPKAAQRAALLAQLQGLSS